MRTKSKTSASIEEINSLYNRAEGHNLYKGDYEETHHLEAYLLQTALLEGVLVNYGLRLLEERDDLSALKGKRKDRYGYDNAINDLYLLGAITTNEFKELEKFKNKRNQNIHNLLQQGIEAMEKEVKKIYEDYRLLVGDMIHKLEKKLSKAK